MFPSMQPRLLATMVTTTSYGAWLPGDLRGYVDNGVVLPGDPERFDEAVRRMGGRSPVIFNAGQQTRLFEAICAAADEFGYQLTDASIESWHAHWIVSHGFDSVATMVGRLKNRMRQALGIGRVWTAEYYDTLPFEQPAVLIRRGYILRHEGCRMTGGRIVR
jgi:hypothetical protein